MERYALVSVYEKVGLEEVVQFFRRHNIRVLSTGGTATYLRELGADVISVESFTQSPEILGGRVKTLHPRIHGGILARRENPDDLAELQSIGGVPIDFVVVNLYPFTKKVAERVSGQNPSAESLVELIDIGGPTMIRAAAKNHRDVVPLVDPVDYGAVIAEWDRDGACSLTTRRRLASKVFSTMSAYDGEVARYFALDEKLLTDTGEAVLLAPIEALTLVEKQPLRYGENPHQSAALYRRAHAVHTKESWKQLQGKELSYNNLLDFQASVLLALDLHGQFPDRAAVAIIKHLNPCGAAVRSSVLEAFEAARACDPVSAFGGIVAVVGELDEQTAKTIIEGFVEVVACDRISEGARAVFEAKKNIRVIEADYRQLRAFTTRPQFTIRECFEDLLVQSSDATLRSVAMAEVASRRIPTADELEDLQFAWTLCKHVKSNAIVLGKNLQAIGVGAGQMSRVDSARLALSRARANGFDPHGAAAGSDAFLPFPDTLEILGEGGVRALAQPGGSIKDSEVKAAADRLGMAMVLTGERHFRH